MTPGDEPQLPTLRHWWIALASGLAFMLLLPSTGQGAEVTHRVRMYWDFDPVEIDLYGEDSPRHVANFLRYVDEGLYDFTYSHRSYSLSSKFIQGGSFYSTSPFNPSTLHQYSVPSHDPIDNEYDATNGLTNSPGTIAAARMEDPDSATAGWFVNVTDNSAGFAGYTVFGAVSDGWDTFQLLPYQPLAGDIYGSQVYSAVATAPLVNYGSPSSPNYIPPPFYAWVRVPLIEGDFNLDGYVDSNDFDVWFAGQGVGSAANLTADADGDADVDEFDLAIMQANMGSGTLNNLIGDYNANGEVNEADFLWWQTTFGATDTMDADGNGDGVVDLADYTVWRNHLGATLGASSATAVVVPEPTSWVLLASLAGCFLLAQKSGPRMSRTHADR